MTEVETGPPDLSRIDTVWTNCTVGPTVTLAFFRPVELVTKVEEILGLESATFLTELDVVYLVEIGTELPTALKAVLVIEYLVLSGTEAWVALVPAADSAYLVLRATAAEDGLAPTAEVVNLTVAFPNVAEAFFLTVAAVRI